jgi:hypothetical protein
VTSPTDQRATEHTDRPVAATIVGVLAVLGVIGSIIMTLAHLDLEIPVISQFGPTGRAIVPVAIGFAVGTVLFAATAYGAFRRTSWAWPVALVVNGLAFISSVMPWRGLENSGVPALVTLIALGVLLSPAGREALLYRGIRDKA